MELKWLLDFLSLCNTGNFTLSAEERHLSPSAFGRRIRSLETWVGQELFDRSQHPVELTEAGNCLRQRAEQFLNMAQEMKNEVGRLCRLSDSNFVFALAPDVSDTILSSWLHSLSAELGSRTATVKIAEAETERVFSSLLDSKIDFYVALDYGAGSERNIPPGIESSMLAEDTLVPVCRRDLLPTGESDTLSELAECLPYISNAEESAAERLITASLTPVGTSNRVPRRFEVVDASHRKTLVLEGLGFSWLSYRDVERDLDAGTLSLLGGAQDKISVKIMMYRAAGSQCRERNRLWRIIAPGQPL